MNAEINVEKIVYPGKCLGRGEDGIAVFVEGALPGEKVVVDIYKNKKTFKEARLLNIIEPSKNRTEAKCPLFGKCGGCSFQHTDYNTQLSIKEGYVNELLEGLGGEISPIIRSPLEWGYRNKMEFSFFDFDGAVNIGLHEKNEFNRFLGIPPCFICDKDFLYVTEKIKEFARNSDFLSYNRKTHQGFYRHLVLRKGINTGQVLVNLVTNVNDTVTKEFFNPLLESLKDKVNCFYWTVNSSVSDAVNAEKLILLYGREIIEEKLTIKGRPYYFTISPFSFFQTNTLGTEKLYEIVVDLLNGNSDDILLDLYCGTGTIGIIAAPYVKNVYGVEQIESAVENAVFNSKQNNIENITFESGSVEKWIKKNKYSDNFPYNAVILDPPRGGLSNKVIDLVLNKKPAKVIYVSCNPSTLARDLKELTAAGSYTINKIIPIDMFPQTFHVETVVSMSCS